LPSKKLSEHLSKIKNGLLVTEYLATVATVMLPSKQGMKLFIAFEAIMHISIRHPLFLRAESCLDNFANFLVHFIIINNEINGEWLIALA
jgi:hypothetical protein